MKVCISHRRNVPSSSARIEFAHSFPASTIGPGLGFDAGSCAWLSASRICMMRMAVVVFVMLRIPPNRALVGVYTIRGRDDRNFD